jgi:hypothetical protein
MTANKILILLIIFIIAGFRFYLYRSKIHLSTDLFNEEREDNLKIKTKKFIKAIEDSPRLGENLDKSFSQDKLTHDLSSRIDEIAKGHELSLEAKEIYLSSMMENNEESLSLIISKYEALVHDDESSHLRFQYLLLANQICYTYQNENCNSFFSGIVLDKNNSIDSQMTALRGFIGISSLSFEEKSKLIEAYSGQTTESGILLEIQEIKNILKSQMENPAKDDQSIKEESAEELDI